MGKGAFRGEDPLCAAGEVKRAGALKAPALEYRKIQKRRDRWMITSPDVPERESFPL